MKKKIVICIAVIVALVLLIPIPMRLKDGGSVVYQAKNCPKNYCRGPYNTS